MESEENRFYEALGFNLEDLYKLSYKFFKEKDGSKALHTTYKDKLKLVALTKQVSFGKFRSDAMPEVGFFDVVGNDRKQAWQSLGEMPQEKAMSEFVTMVQSLSPLFLPYIKAHLAEKEEVEQKKKEQEERAKAETLDQIRLEQAVKQQEEEKQKQHAQELMIRAALNKQTEAQFQQYAEQQYPGNQAQQEALIIQLQEQHFVHYMQQVYQQQLLLQQQQQQLQQNGGSVEQLASGHNLSNNSASNINGDGATRAAVNHASNAVELSLMNQTNISASEMAGKIQSSVLTDETLMKENGLPAFGNDVIDPNDLPPIAAASMWTRKDIKEFKDSLRNDPESVIKVGSGELVTVRVPTHDDGSCLFWEFATDSYDIGFGVYFEWTIANTNETSVQVHESSDEDDDEEDESGNVRSEGEGREKPPASEPPTDEIIPAYRRDCHEEVYCGSHVYPGCGVYLLKFDNSYSLWRGKTVYYRVYYTR